MKVLYIFDEDDKYGAPKAGMEMIDELVKNDITPIVITSNANEINKICDKKNIENYITYHHKYTYVKSNDFFQYIIKLIPRYIRYILGVKKALKIIEKNIEMKSIDIIHTNISGIDLGCILAKKYKKKHIMHIREFGELDFNMKSYRKNYIKFLNSHVDKFITISNSIKKYWIKKGINKNKIDTIYDGVFIDDIAIKKEFNDKDTKLNILMLGSISPGKGQIELVKAIAMLDEEIKNNCKVNIFGSGYKEEEKKVEKEIYKNNLSKVIEFKGYEKDIRNKIKNYDIGINCSKAEGFGRVTIEYMSAGLLVIASNTGANIEIIEDNISGLIYEQGNYKDLSEKIKFVYNNKKILKEFSKRAIENVNKNFNQDKNTKMIINCYEKLLKGE